ncbi:26S proteasome regulatory subunit N10 [Pancytospora epiphaga]|nr:26S proteasome regulatory subunit N10 [Pancytospora epiphaga]KAI5176672.1 26S proteasome regulatory subunit N10 [Pancytospora epiphaga]
MPEITVIILDNGYSSQNQDYLPSRFILQKDIADALVTRALEADSESIIGLIPLSQNIYNNILTPTKVRPYLSEFLAKLGLSSPYDANLSLYQADICLHIREYTTKHLVIFFSSPVTNEEEVLTNLYVIASKGIIVKVICFGDALKFGVTLTREIDFENFSCLCLTPDLNFDESVLSFLGSSMNICDPELEEAIKRSLQQQ